MVPIMEKGLEQRSYVVTLRIKVEGSLPFLDLKSAYGSVFRLDLMDRLWYRIDYQVSQKIA